GYAFVGTGHRLAFLKLAKTRVCTDKKLSIIRAMHQKEVARKGHGMPVPDDQTLMRPLRESLGMGPLSLQELVERLSNTLERSNEDRARLTPSGRSTLIYNRVAWAATYLRKAGLIESPRRGTNQITA